MIINMFYAKSKTIINFAYSEGSGGGGGGEKIVIPDGWTQEDKTVTTIDTSNWDTSQMTTMEYMFSGCTALTNLDVSKFNTSNVTDMDGMFADCSSLKSLDLSKWDTSKLGTMLNMFRGCSSLESLDLSNFDTTNMLISMPVFSIFDGCSSLTKITFSSKFFNTVPNNPEKQVYDFSGASNWTDADSLATLVEALPTVEKSKKQILVLSNKSYDALTESQKTAITDKGWTVMDFETYNNYFEI